MTTDSFYISLQQALEQAGFAGDFITDWSMLTAATGDNSVYQITPDAILMPLDTDDLLVAMQVLNQPEYSDLPITARGGATGTNGQSLNTGIIIDFKRYMQRIINIDIDNQEATIEPGVVLEKINAELKSSGLFFAPHTSSGSRCTIGGMIATDASGKGSRIYGKTGDNISELEVILAEGKRLQLKPMNAEALQATSDTRLQHACEICHQASPELQSRLPNLTRHFVGYDIIGATKKAGFDPVKLFVGAEGTLGLVTKAKLKLTPIPKHKRLVLIAYDSFYAALQSATLLLKHEPTAVETIDDHIQILAHRYGVAKRLPEKLRAPLPNGQVPICNFIEYAGDDISLINKQIEALISDLEKEKSVIAWHIADDEQEIEKLWEIRKLSAGLLKATNDNRTPIPFIEDCVVGAEKVADFAMEFRELLDNEGVQYGMFGHVDVGCLHIRPALDLENNEDQIRLKRISDNVLKLVEKYNGIFWGEHGKGVRGEYLPKFVGDNVYQSFADIKRLFDPKNRMNPGKLVAPNGDKNTLWKIDKTPFRTHKLLNFNGDKDLFHNAFNCNGNALCQSYSTTTPMCPSYKVTKDIRHSPKGRADILRNWRTLNLKEPNKAKEIEEEVYEVLEGCLGCKACTSSCPVQVDIPELKSRFYEHYFNARQRPLKHLMISNLEKFGALGLKVPYFMNRLLNLKISKKILTNYIGLQDLPNFSMPILANNNLKIWGINELYKNQQSLPEKTIFLLSDSFNMSFDQQTLNDVQTAFSKLGYNALVTKCLPSGKPLHVIGNRKNFIRVAQHYAHNLRKLSKANVPIIAVEPTLAALLQQEYKDLPEIPSVHTVSKFLIEEIDQGCAITWPLDNITLPSTTPAILLHCTERTLYPETSKEWQRFFTFIGKKVTVPELGCCGMAGIYGHEVQHYDNSRELFKMNWEQQCKENQSVTATGFSCRSQIERFGNTHAAHPLSLLA